MNNLFSIFIERFTIFTVLIFVILKNLMVFISPPLWTLWNYKKQKLRDGLIIATGSLVLSHQRDREIRKVSKTEA